MSEKHFNGTRKDYAISKGLAKPGKGRMSLAAHEAVDKAIADGMTFSDYRVSKTPQKGTESVSEGPQDQVENPYADAFWRYPLDQQFTYTHEGKTRVINGRGVCRGCGYSLVGHLCSDPVVLTQDGWQAVKPKGE